MPRSAARLGRGDRRSRPRGGEAGAPFVEEDEPAERREPLPQRGPARILPPMLQVGDEPHDLQLLLPGETEKHMSCPRNVRIVGGILLALVLPATIWGLYVLAVLFVTFGLPRLFAPGRSIRLQ